MEIMNMEAKELKKLSRSELLEMLLDRSKEVEHLRKELDETKKHIQTLEREVKTSGDINAAINKLTSATEEIQKFAAVISMASNNLTRKQYFVVMKWIIGQKNDRKNI